MVTIKLSIRGQHISLLNKIPKVTVSDSVNYFRCQFTFDSTWSSFSEISVFFKNISSGVVKAGVLDADGFCFIPWEVLQNTGVIIVNAVGFAMEGDQLVEKLPCFPLKLFCQTEEGSVNTTPIEEITPSQFEQFVSNVQDYSVTAVSARNEAEGFSGNAQDSAVNSSISASEAASSALNAYNSSVSANAASVSASSSKSDALIAKTLAESAATSAGNSADSAAASASLIQNLTVSSSTLSPGSSAFVEKTETEFGYNFAFGIPAGAIGDRGPQGEAGPQGIQGDKGDTGDTGPQGPQGEIGATGLAGAKGDKGDAGTTSWNGIIDKPDTFPPASHNHTKGNITDFPTGLSEFTDDLGSSPAHTHSQYLTSHQDVTGKEDHVNKVTAWSNPTTDLHYPSEKLVKNTFDIKQDIVDLSIVNGMLCVTYEEV